MSHQPADPHAKHTASSDSTWLWSIGLGALALAGAAVMVAPNILPMMGIGDKELASEAFAAMHAAEAPGTGLAGSINGIIQKIPLLGPGLAEGGALTAFTCGGIGLGGIVLSDYVEEREDKSERISISKTIKYGSLITSALIALPTILTGLSIGIVYLCGALGDGELASQAVDNLYNTLGSTHRLPGAAGIVGLAAAMSHVGTCGIPVLSAILGQQHDYEKQAEQTGYATQYEKSGNWSGYVSQLPPANWGRQV